MKKFILLSLAMFTGMILYPQEKKMNQTIHDQKSDHDIMIGYCTFQGITDTAFNSSFRTEYNSYNPDPLIIDQIHSLMDAITVTIVSGTWCSDSREQVPRFMKILDLIEPVIPEPVLICVDRDKKAADVPLEELKILKVPTFIIYHDKSEIGRIIETPQTTLEEDFLMILRRKL
jgi:hypothetical protein